MRTVFFGTPELAVPCLEAVAARHEVAAVVCQPDKPRGRGKKLAPPPVKVWARAHGLAVHQPAKLNDGAFEAWLREQRPELCTIAAYGRLLKQPILDVPPHGFINMHPSLLPRWRGPSPIQSAVLAGDSVTGVTIMKLTLDMDAGPIIRQEKTGIGENETAAELAGRLAPQGARVLAQAVDEIAGGSANYTPQDDAEAVYCRMLKKEDGFIDWSKPAHMLHNQVRGCQPWPVAQCVWHGTVCRIHRSAVLDKPATASPGTVTLVAKDRIGVATGAGQLTILEFQAPGKNVMSMEAFLRGHTIERGERFESRT